MVDPDMPICRMRLQPHRSLSRRQARRVIVTVGCVTTLLSIPFTLIGAWPVVGFLGLDVLALAVAFALSFRAARAREDIAVTPVELSVAKIAANGRRSEWRFNPLWVRLVRHDDEEFGLLGLSLSSRGRAVELGAFLAPAARETVARDLTRALSEARRGPRFGSA